MYLYNPRIVMCSWFDSDICHVTANSHLCRHLKYFNSFVSWSSVYGIASGA